MEPVAPTDPPTLLVGAEAERTWLDPSSWVDVVRGFVAGADELYAALAGQEGWQPSRVFRYDHWHDEPRLTRAHHVADAPHPALVEVQRDLHRRYRVRFDGFSLAWYRNGRDSVAFHRDRDMRWLDDTVIALLVLGERRPFLLRPRRNRYDHEAERHGATHDLAPGHGDLLVMGGACQAGWEHAVPKVPGPVGGRISAQWRWTSRRGRPVQGASYRAPRTYDR